MSSHYTLSKGVTDAQFAAFEAARMIARLTPNQAKDRAFRLFCEAQGVAWPDTAPPGGDRRSEIARLKRETGVTYPYATMTCPRCSETMIAEPPHTIYVCEACGLHAAKTPDGWQNYEIIDGERVERDHNNRGEGW